MFGNDVGSQIGVPTLVKGYSALGGHIVLNQKIVLGKSSYQQEVQQLIAAKPQVIFTETSPEANATYLGELQQLGHLVPVIGTDVTIQPTWFTAMAESIGKSALTQYFVAEQPYAPPSGPGWQVYNKNLLASASVPKPAQWSTDSYTMTYYDSVVLMALAATLAKSTNPAVWNASIPAVVSPGAVVVHTYAAGVAALQTHKKIDYVGAAGGIDFNRWHNSGGAFEIAAYQPNGDLTLVNQITAANLAPLIK